MDSLPLELIKTFSKYLNNLDKYVLLFVSKKFALLVGKQESKSIITQIIQNGTVNQLLWAKTYGHTYLSKLFRYFGNLFINFSGRLSIFYCFIY